MTPSKLQQDELEFIAEFSENNPDLVRARFASRHSSSKKYLATVEFDIDRDDEPITGWYCTCAAGEREIGCCAHITALIWQLGVCRANIETATNPLTSDRIHEFIQDAAAVTNSSESETESDDGSRDGEDSSD